MAQFTGSGKLTLNGPDSRFYDFECSNEGGFEMNGNRQRLENCYMKTPIAVTDNSREVLIRGNTINMAGAPCVEFQGRNHDAVVVGNYITDGVGGG